ncbi:CutC family protein [Gonapodya prolifera JEL478]|uniref:Copper homeostasis protein cutC homolog n=1 Tax=Gonapodya prolifera (strain JEL478) TaxID=1344416 RepID=A0A139ASY7_GONPJ|nr:CutC family protein [Gonapodya prolifera JEL478]|eukprot:KXS19846.1 CutC family protein [Gonapodya prolifera JEL478]
MDVTFTPAHAQRQPSVTGLLALKSNAPRILLESCVENVESALISEANGAERIELCANLLEGGTTPSAGMIQICKERLRIPIHVMIRPRGGDFLYTDLEFAVMRRDIEACKQIGVAGVVLGILKHDGTIDVERTTDLATLAAPLAVTFHRAFDVTSDPYVALSALAGIPNVTRLLTSGQAPTVLEGLRLIHALMERTPPHLSILPGGGITPGTLPYILEASAAAGVEMRELHMAIAGVVASPMEFRRPEVYMGGLIGPPEYERSVADPGKVRAVVERLRR